MPKIDIVREAQARLEAAWVQDRENREDAFMDLKFLSGDQWPDEIRQQREAQARPCLTINRLPQFVHQAANTVRVNPPAIKAVPAGGEATAELAEIYTGLMRQIQYRSNATNVFANAAEPSRRWSWASRLRYRYSRKGSQMPGIGRPLLVRSRLAKV